MLGIQILMGGVIKTYVQPNMARVMDEVQEGTLDYALTKPADAQLLVSVREVRIWQIVDVISGLDRPGVRPLADRDRRRPTDALAFAIALVFGGRCSTASG